ncbi:MAG: sodium:alanine symporter family protein [Clostridia bacterium]|nr:sodium:alanine symporter family protein [Clostridia bacterium]
MNILDFISEYIASPALTAAVTCCGVFFTARLKPFEKIRSLFRRKTFEKNGKDGISPLSSLSVALAGTLGVGNISGVAVAVSVGGAGAVFWMFLSAVLGAALKYCEAYLSVKIRPAGKKTGGAPYYIGRICGGGAGRAYAVICIAASFVSGSLIQMNAAASSFSFTYSVPGAAVGAVFAAACAFTVIGGIKRVSAFTSAAMPVFCAIFAALSVIAISMKLNEVPAVVSRIFTEAFGFSQALGGFSGALVSAAVRAGMTKGVFSHEAGCGTSSFSHAASSASSPALQGLVGVAEVLADTVFFGGLTALVILLSHQEDGGRCHDGAAVAIRAYSYFFGGSAGYILTFLTVFFAYATVICWAYYGCLCVRYLTASEKAVTVYIILYCASLIPGSVVSSAAVWALSDICCAATALINCACLIKGRKLIK